MEYLHDGSNRKCTENDPENLHCPDCCLFSDLHIPFILNAIGNVSLRKIYQPDANNERDLNKERYVKFYGVPENNEQCKSNAPKYEIEGIFFHGLTLLWEYNTL
jgi:hypothetical protein